MKKFGFRAALAAAFMGPAQRAGLGCGCTHSRGPGGGIGAGGSGLGRC